MGKNTRSGAARSGGGSSRSGKIRVVKGGAKSAKVATGQAPKSTLVKEKAPIYGSPGRGKLTAVRAEYAARGEVILADRPEFALTPFEKMQIVEEGISKKALEKLKEKSGLDYDQLSRLLNVSRTTLIALKGKAKFNTDISDKILGLADIYSYGYEVFEDHSRFNEWIFRPNGALGGQSPFELLRNSFGREEVKNLIGRIDHGIYS